MGSKRRRQTEMRDGAIRFAGIVDQDASAIHRWRCCKSLVAVVRLLEVLEPVAVLSLVRFTPFGVRPKRIEVLVDIHLAQRVRRVVHVDERAARVKLGLRLIERRDDRVADTLLPVSRGVSRRRRRRALIWDLLKQSHGAEQK